MVYSMKYYSAVKKKEILPYAPTQRDPENIMFSEISQRKSSTLCCHLYVKSKNNTSQCISKTETDSQA